jgi:hypothetical protein
MNGPNKLECYITILEKLAKNRLAYLAHTYITKKIKCCEYSPCDYIHNTSFSSQLMNGPNKLECYITQHWKGLPKTNSLAYLAHTTYEGNEVLGILLL